MRHPLLIVAVVLVLTLVAASAAAEPLRLTVSTTVSDGAGNERRLPPGYFLEDGTWSALDAELRRLQEAETRLAAENQSLRKSAGAPPRWWWVVVGVATGATAGFAVGRL